MKTHKPKKVVSRAYTPEDDDTLLATLRAANYYDSLQLTERSGRGAFTRSVRLFGNANIGRFDLCNLQTPRQIVAGAFVITNWYARTDVPASVPEIDRLMYQFAHNTMCVVHIGEKVKWQASVFDLLRSWRGPYVPVPGAESAEPGNAGQPQRVLRPLWPLLVPRRQNISVLLDMFGDPDELIQYLDQTGYGWSSQRPFNLWIHLEGVVIPEWSDYDGTDEDAEAHWAHLTGRVMRLLTRSEREVASTAEHIARWIGNLAIEDRENEAQLVAIADAIREGTYKPKARE